LDLDVDYEDEDLMKFLEETDCHLYYLLIWFEGERMAKRKKVKKSDFFFQML
jgi:hypothetical protein